MENKLVKIFDTLKKEKYAVYGPKEQDGLPATLSLARRAGELHILELEKIPLNPPFQKGEGFVWPWKYFFTPTRETLYKYEGGKLKVPPQKSEKRALFGMSIFDCKALELYDKVFENDIYYQQNRKNIFVVGYSPMPLEKIKTPFFEVNLASAVFDIFIEGNPPAGGKFFARSKKGEEILKKCGIKYKLVKYAPHKPDKKVVAIMKAIENGKDSKLWDELGEICLACGKCTIACLTCYCFDFESSVGPEKKTERCNGNCFYDDFTRIAGGHKFLNNPKEKIFFWYYHKFVRIPHGYGLPGCTDCGRCSAVCPVGIDIRKNIERLLKEAKNKK